MNKSVQYSITQTLSEYLEAIYTLSVNNQRVRTTDVAAKLGISKPSVNRAVNSLKNAGYVSHQPYGDIRLTETGLMYSETAFARHGQIKKFLTDFLDISIEDAEREASLIERGLSKNTVEKLINFMEKQQIGA